MQSYFDVSTVVSLNADGSPASRYGDRSWDYTASTLDCASVRTLNFFEPSDDENGELAQTIREQQKALLWVQLEAGQLLALSSFMMVNYAATAWAERALKRQMTLFDLLIDPILLEDELPTLNTGYVDLTVNLVKALWRYAKKFGVEVKVPLQKLRSIISDESNRRPKDRQTPIIPSRIYCEILGQLVEGLDRIEREVSLLIVAYEARMSPNDLTILPVFKKNITKKSVIARRALLRKQAVEPLVQSLKEFGYSEKEGRISNFIEARFGAIRSWLMHALAAFSGMRVGEVGVIPRHGAIETFEIDGAIHHVINGYTSKLRHGQKVSATWITNDIGRRAILIAQRISDAIYEQVGRTPRSGQEQLLFCSTRNAFRKISNSTITREQAALISQISPIINQTDLNEIDAMELERNWLRDGIQVSKRWPLTFHQLRRSLSVYAHRSGMVSLPAMKGQFQHLTDEMREYYADGFSMAVNLIFDEDHFSHEWNAAKAESAYFGYAIGVLMGADQAMGRGVDRLDDLFFSRPRKEVYALFEKGRLAYKDTVLGGCISTEECKASPLEPIPFDCLQSNCINQVVLAKRLDYVIGVQQTTVKHLEKCNAESVEYRIEAGNLRKLLDARARFSEGIN